MKMPIIEADPLAAEIRREQEREHRRELRRLDDFAFIFLHATNGDVREAEELLDKFIDLLCEDGVLSTWRYRTVLNRLREGL